MTADEPDDSFERERSEWASVAQWLNEVSQANEYDGEETGVSERLVSKKKERARNDLATGTHCPVFCEGWPYTL